MYHFIFVCNYLNHIICIVWEINEQYQTESPCALFLTGLGHRTGLSSKLHIFDLSEIMCQYYFWTSPSLTKWKNHKAEEEISQPSTNPQQTERGFRNNDQKNDSQEEYWQWSINLTHRAEEPSGERASARQV